MGEVDGEREYEESMVGKLSSECKINKLIDLKMHSNIMRYLKIC